MQEAIYTFSFSPHIDKESPADKPVTCLRGFFYIPKQCLFLSGFPTPTDSSGLKMRENKSITGTSRETLPNKDRVSLSTYKFKCICAFSCFS